MFYLGAEVSLATLQSTQVVGIYFHNDIYNFTRKLIEVYKECQNTGKSFEIVHVSKGAIYQEEFDELFGKISLFYHSK